VLAAVAGAVLSELGGYLIRRRKHRANWRRDRRR